MKELLKKSPPYIVLALLIYVPVFGFLDILPIRIWDEARIAVSSLEMLANGDYIVSYFRGAPDTWNTKPPLLNWLQVFLMNTIGINELAVRLPSAFAVFFTCLALFFFSTRYLKSFWTGFIAVVLLITSEGYVGIHVGRTGDYDALLVFFTTAGCLSFFSYCETKKTKFLYLFFLALTLGGLTKGIASLLCTPALLLFVLFEKQLFSILKNKHFYIGLVGFLFFVVGYYFLREMKQPGFFKIIEENELGGRFLVSQGGHEFDFWFYYKNLLLYRLPDRYLLIPCGLLLGAVSLNPRVRKVTLFLTLIILTYFIVISSAKTKMEWYDAPLYPFISLLIALFINFLFEFFKNNELINRSLRTNVLPYVFLFLVLILPYRKIWERTWQGPEYSWDIDFYTTGYYLQESVKGHHNLNNVYFFYDGYCAQFLFYTEILKRRGVKTDFKESYDIQPHDVLIVSQENMKQFLREKYNCTEAQIKWSVARFTLNGLKNK